MMAERRVRVRVYEAWDDVELTIDETATVADVKQQVLDIAGITDDAGGYAVKFRGFELRDEAAALRDAGIPDLGALIVLPRRRLPVR